MYKVKPSKARIRSYTLLSGLGAVLALFVAVLPSLLRIFPATAPVVRKLIVGIIYSGICTLGLVAAIFPRKCMNKKSAPNQDHKAEDDGVVYELEGKSLLCGVTINHSHHPACEQFDPHELIFGNKSICAGCLGLSIGAVVSICTSLIYFGGFYSPTASLAPYFIVFGTISNMVMFGRYLWPHMGSPIRVVLHAAMVIGASFLLIGVDLIGQNLLFDYLAILLVLFWLRTKLLLTKWEHYKVCVVCDSPCASNV